MNSINSLDRKGDRDIQFFSTSNIYIYIYIYMNESKYGSKSDSMKKAEKQNNPNLTDLDPYLLSYCPFGKTNTKYILTWHLTWMTSKRDIYIYIYIYIYI